MAANRAKRQSLAAATVGSFAEAWAEVRIHKTRVLLSLIGVAVAVTAITSVVGLGSIVEQSTLESFEQSGGRAATIGISVSQNGDTPVDYADVALAVKTAADRYKITYHSASLYGSQRVQSPNGVLDTQARGVDPLFGAMHRITVLHGSWFEATAASRLAPPIVISEGLWQLLGSPSLDSHPTAQLVGESPRTAVIIGVIKNQYDGDLSTYLLPASLTSEADFAAQSGGQLGFELWVPATEAKQLVTLVKRDLKASLSGTANVIVNRQDYGTRGGDPLKVVKIGVGGVAFLVLFLGALGLVNISLVTVRQRIREIGIRRSFGATAGRVFFAVMMESVVATFAAGVVGVGVAIAIVENPWVQGKLAQGATDLPSFPIEAALFGLVSATVVGALAGLLPAIAAVRFKVIDAIRY
jgi:putative ABC transport system permease protein